MNLTIDIGNSRTKVGVFEEDEIKFVQTFDNLTVKDLEKIMAEHEARFSIVSSVKEPDHDIDAFLAKSTNQIKYDFTVNVPIKNLYKSADTLGKDRLAAVIGANALYLGKDLLVIDTGTCITYNFINRKNEFIGGSIAPGINMRLKSLNTFTGKLPLVEQETINELIGTDTKSAILSGVMNGAAFEMDETINQYKATYPGVKTLVTGGNMEYFESRLKNKIFAVPHLVLIGLNKIIQYNVS